MVSRGQVWLEPKSHSHCCKPQLTTAVRLQVSAVPLEFGRRWDKMSRPYTAIDLGCCWMLSRPEDDTNGPGGHSRQMLVLDV